MSARSKARKRAVDILYEADIRRVPAVVVLDEHNTRRAQDGEAALNPYVGELVVGVAHHQERIDELLTTYATGWSIGRMPAVDRAILRLGSYEVLWGREIPDAVAIAEAVGLAGDLSTEESASFVNGLLGRLAELKPRLDLQE